VIRAVRLARKPLFACAPALQFLEADSHENCLRFGAQRRAGELDPSIGLLMDLPGEFAL
jgi:hypothetical protein